MIKVRDMREDERAFVLDSWINSYCAFHAWADGSRRCVAARHRSSSPNEVKSLHEHLVNGLLATADVSIAVHEDEPDVILGWVCHGVRQDGRKVVHYLYTKQSARSQGIMGTLLDHATEKQRWIATHFTPAFDLKRITALGGWYDPFSCF